nr:26S proteasome regulatory subunit 4 homolog A [Tanacetum cinerariifolium]
ELIQKYLGDGPKLVRELLRVADDLSPSIVFVDEINAIVQRATRNMDHVRKMYHRRDMKRRRDMDNRASVKVNMNGKTMVSAKPHVFVSLWEQVLGVKRWSEKTESTDLYKEEEYLKNVEKLLLDAQEECEYVKFEKDTLQE